MPPNSIWADVVLFACGLGLAYAMAHGHVTVMTVTALLVVVAALRGD